MLEERRMALVASWNGSYLESSYFLRHGLLLHPAPAGRQGKAWQEAITLPPGANDLHVRVLVTLGSVRKQVLGLGRNSTLVSGIWDHTIRCFQSLVRKRLL